MPKFKIPTDEEISAMVGGIPVISYRPEDLPHFKPSIFDSYTEDELRDRIEYVREKWKTVSSPSVNFDGAQEGLRRVAGQRSPHLDNTDIIFADAPEKNRKFFGLLRPSNLINSNFRLANNLSFEASKIQSNIPIEDLHFIDIYHEIGHMHFAKEIAEGKRSAFKNDFEEEFEADKFALNQYLNAGGSIKIVKSYIEERALCAFLNQPMEYWIAPDLSEEFFGTQNDHTPLGKNWENAINIYDELRHRAVDHATGRNLLIKYPSDELQTAFKLLKQCGPREFEEAYPDIASAVKMTKRHFRGDLDTPDNKIRLLRSLPQILENEKISPEVSACGSQIVYASQKSIIDLKSALSGLKSIFDHLAHGHFIQALSETAHCTMNGLYSVTRALHLTH